MRDPRHQNPSILLALDSPRGPRLLVLDRRRSPIGRLAALGALLGIALLLNSASGGAGQATVAAANGPDTGQVLVKFRPNASQQAIDALNASMATRQVDAIAAIGVKVLQLPAGQSSQAAASVYARNPLVQFAEPNTVKMALDTVPNDPQISLNQWGVQKVKGPAAWDITTGSSTAVIAVLDTGVWAGHPDLAGKVGAGYNFVASNTNTGDDNGHGTGVAGVAAAATNNSIGMAGMSWQSPVMPVKVCDAAGSCLDSWITNGMTWAADHGARVINMSLGGPGSCGATLQSAVDYAWSRGVVIVAASGNGGGAVDAPANCTNVVAVGATNSSDARPSWSNYGSALDLVAPGATIACPSLSGGYAAGTGTSFAAPFVSGTAALLVAKGATNSAAVTALTAGTDDLGPAGWDQEYGSGRLNAFKALGALGGVPLPTATATSGPPTATATPAVTSTAPPAPTATATSAAPTATATPVAPTATATLPPAPSSDTTPPVVTLTSPANGASLGGGVTLSATASDNVGVVRVEFYIDGVLLKTDTRAPYSTGWNTRRSANGAHTVTAKAYDGAGNVASDSHTVTVAN